ncbi:MAG: flagellar basal body-associated protein FliL [Paralcaligenes sp.]
MTKTIVGIILIAAASIGATVFYFAEFASPSAHAKTTATAKPVPLPGPIFVPLEPFTVTLRDDNSSRILYVAITLRVADEASLKLLDLYMPEVRNRVLLELSIQSPTGVQTSQGRTQLAQDLAKVLKAPYLPQPHGPSISNVLFTAFVVQ